MTNLAAYARLRNQGCIRGEIFEDNNYKRLHHHHHQNLAEVDNIYLRYKLNRT